MPLVQTRGAASAQGFGEFAQASAVNYIEEVFSCFLYTGTGSSQTITNGIDLSTKGGLAWVKQRDFANGHILVDTVRGGGNYLQTNTTGANEPNATVIPTFTTTGFNTGGAIDSPAKTYASWTFRKQPKFFDVVTYTGTGSNTTIAHSLGSVPGSIIVKRTDTTADWAVYHRSLANTQYLVLNTTAAAATGATWWNSTTPTSSVFSVGTDASVNASGGTYVAYLFAHDAGGFGLSGTDNVISCGSYTQGSGDTAITLGYEPQWVMIKSTDGSGSSWAITDNMRAMPVSGSASSVLNANLSNAENSSIYGVHATSTGFISNGFTSGTFVYVAIRRGPMKVPTLGTTVFSPVTSSAQTGTITSGFPTDLVMELDRTTGQVNFNRMFQDRLRGKFQILGSASTAAETNNTSTASFDSNTGIILNGGGVYLNGFVYEQFRRAPSFFDEVAGKYFGGNLTHNLGVVPELVIAKQRDGVNGWYVWTTGFTTSQYLFLNSTAAIGSALVWNTMTSTEIGLQNLLPSNTGVYYLFATCPGVSKVGSYTGTGALQTVNCGFTGGARFVLIKRTDSTGDWWTYDSARGITSGDDPYLYLNSTAAEVTNTNYVDTDTTGFKVTAAAPAELNANGGNFIFLAIA